MPILRLLGNVLWIIFGGLIAAIGYFLGGIVLCLTLVGIPFGIQAIKLGFATLVPFGKEVVEGQHANSVGRVVFNVLWILFFGWEIALAHLVSAVLLALTVVGIPFALQHIKLIPLSLLPFGRQLRPVS